MNIAAMRLLAVTYLAAFVLGAPKSPRDFSVDSSAHISKRAVICGQGDVVHTADYNVRNDLFPVGALGSQCTNVRGQANEPLIWSTKWSWDGSASQKKSFAAADLRRVGFVPISSYTSLQTTWEWR